MRSLNSLLGDWLLPSVILLKDAPKANVPFAVNAVAPFTLKAISPDLYAKAILTIPAVKAALDMLSVPDVVGAVIAVLITLLVNVRKVTLLAVAPSSMRMMYVSLAMFRISTSA